jgi:chromosome segregation ATPase
VPSKNGYDPYEIIKYFGEIWGKQINDYINLVTNNSEYGELIKRGNDPLARQLEFFRKNQEVLANILNLPTKNDLKNLANFHIQTEEKIESLEEQIWSLQDSIKVTNKDIESVVEVSKEIIKLTKQLKTELVKTKKELAETKVFQSDLQDMKKELAQLNSFKEEFEMLKSLIDKGDQKASILAGSTSAQPK